MSVIKVRPYNADKTKSMRSLNPEDIDQLVTLTGMVVRCSDPIPTLTEGLFKCSVCGNVVTSEVSTKMKNRVSPNFESFDRDEFG